MLVLTRKANEQIHIGDQVVITILKVKGQSVRVGIEAPREVHVLRAELPRFQSETSSAGIDFQPRGTTQRRVDEQPPAESRVARTARTGEQAFAALTSPLAAKLIARRASDAGPTTSTTRFQASGAGVRT